MAARSQTGHAKQASKDYLELTARHAAQKMSLSRLRFVTISLFSNSDPIGKYVARRIPTRCLQPTYLEEAALLELKVPLTGTPTVAEGPAI